MASAVPRTVADLFPGRTFDHLTQCWVAPGEKPIAAELMIGYQAILDDLDERIRRSELPEPPSITCPVCSVRSYNPGDIEHRYCVRCNVFHDDQARRS